MAQEALKIKENGDSIISIQRRVTMMTRIRTHSYRFNFAIILGAFAIIAWTSGIDPPDENLWYYLLGMVAIATIFPLLIPVNKGKVKINTMLRSIWTGNEWMPVHENSTLIQTRSISLIRKYFPGTYRSGRRRKKRTKSKNYISRWVISLDGVEFFIHKEKVGSSVKNRLYNQPWVDQTAEYIAEKLGIGLIDETGIDAHYRLAGETDLSLKEVIKRREIQAINLETFSSNEYEIKETNGIYRIKQHDWYFDSSFIVPAVLILILTVLYLLELDFLRGLIALLLTLLLANFGLMKNQFDIMPDQIMVQVNGLIFPFRQKRMQLDKMEKMIVSNHHKGKFAIEFISDEGRLRIPGGYEEHEAKELEMLIVGILASQNN